MSMVYGLFVEAFSCLTFLLKLVLPLVFRGSGLYLKVFIGFSIITLMTGANDLPIGKKLDVISSR